MNRQEIYMIHFIHSMKMIAHAFFDEDGYKAAYEEMIGIIKKIVHKLQMINNDDFVIEDYITKN